MRTAILCLSMLALSPLAAAQDDVLSWDEAERGVLEHYAQLTHTSEYAKAGEQYFSPDDSKVIYMAIEREADPSKEEKFYQMFVADVVYDRAGHIRGIANARRLTPPGSSNTCGWFHPTDPNVVYFASTIVPPSNPDESGYQRGTKKYLWQFPREMTIVKCDLRKADGTAETLEPVIVDDKAYLAEGAFSPDGRYYVYCSRDVTDDFGGDLYILDVEESRTVQVTSTRGYDGGPFFSPDGRRLCYRSDRDCNNLLQIFVAELAFDDAGRIVGVDREFQITDNIHVNWAPYWHPSGKHLVYTTSEIGHRNYEVFIVDADPGAPSAGPGPTRYGTRKRRVTSAEGFDGLPVFNSDGSVMMWCSQRADGVSQLWTAEFVMPLERGDAGDGSRQAKDERPELLQARDPKSGLIYLYNPNTHELTVYNPRTHEQREIADQAESNRAMELFRQQHQE